MNEISDLASRLAVLTPQNMPVVYICLAVLAAAFQISVCAASDDDKILDIRVESPGKLADFSRFHRPLEDALVAEEDADSAVTAPPKAIQIDYNPDDPLFAGNTGFTYVLKCRFGNLEPFPQNWFAFAGRWDPVRNHRSMAFKFGINGGLGFGISSDGTTEGNRDVMTLTLPANQFLILVGRFNPGISITVAIYDESGALLESQIQRAGIPSEIFEAPGIPFLIGAPVVNGMDFVRMAVWNTCIAESQLDEALQASSFFK